MACRLVDCLPSKHALSVVKAIDRHILLRAPLALILHQTIQNFYRQLVIRLT
jgi:hypothetical protein